MSRRALSEMYLKLKFTFEPKTHCTTFSKKYYGASCLCGEMSWGGLSMGPVVHGAGYSWGKLTMGRVVHGASCPWGELSMG
jgi:hypothetical protein